MKSDPFLVRKTTSEVVTHARSVHIIHEMLPKTVQLLRDGSENVDVYSRSMQQVFLMDCVNFCFWAGKDEEKWKVEYPKGTFHDGWDALVAAFDRAIFEGVPVLEAQYLETLSKEDAKHIFRSVTKTEIPLLSERRENMREAGNVLTTRFGGKFENVLNESGREAAEMLRIILRNFPSFDDTAIYNGKPVYFYKRAQITVLDLAILAHVRIQGIDVLTACADYKLPQLLRSLGVLEYEESLSQCIDTMELLEKGSPEEVEIRAATVQAVEVLSKMLSKTAAETDNLIWHMAAKNELPMQPYHRVLTTAY